MYIIKDFQKYILKAYHRLWIILSTFWKKNYYFYINDTIQKKLKNWIWRNCTPEMLINLPKDALLMSNNKNTGFYVFLDIGWNILQSIFAK